MGRWSKNRRAVSQIIVTTEEGTPALIFELENGKIKPDETQILGTPGYGKLNVLPQKNRTERTSKRGRQSCSTIFDQNNTNSHSQDIMKTNLKRELDQSIKALHAHQSQHKEKSILNQPKKYIQSQNIQPIRSIYSPPPPLNNSNENDKPFTLTTMQNLNYNDSIQDIEPSKNYSEILVSLQDNELEPIPFYTEDDAFDFEFLKQDDFLQITDMKLTLFSDIDPLIESIPDFDLDN